MRVFFTASLISWFAISAGMRVDAQQRAQSSIKALAESVKKGQVQTVEISHVPSEIETAISITPDRFPGWYVLAIHDVNFTPGNKPLLRALSTTPVRPGKASEVRWRIVFFDKQNKETLAIFMDEDGRYGFAAGEWVRLSGELRQWASNVGRRAFR